MFKINDKVNVEHIDGPLPGPCRNYQAKIIKANDDGKCFIVKGGDEREIKC